MKTDHFVVLFDGRKSMRDRHHSYVLAELLAQRLLNHVVALQVCLWTCLMSGRPANQKGDEVHSPMDDVASSIKSNLLLLAIARARAMIWRCPADKFPPRDAICVSRCSRSFENSTSLLSSIPCALSSARRSSASSYCSKGSRFCRIVPAKSSG